MNEIASSSSRTVVDAPVVTVDVTVEARSSWLSFERVQDEIALSSADIAVLGPSASGGGGRAPVSRGRDAAPTPDPLIGLVVADRYRIVEPIGRGGMGIVYKVEHIRIGKLLAMKLLTGELSRNPRVVRRFKREALAASKLASLNTVQVFDFGVSEGFSYLVMELVNGEDIGRRLRAEGPMPFARLGKIAVQVCSSLAEAHRKGIVHRDIKPENIMLLSAEGGADVAKVLDFGLAKLRGSEGLNDVSGNGTIVGTPHYMAPEQIRAEEVDPRADIYSVGALLYRVLTGCHVFTAPSPVMVLSKHLYEIPIPPAERAPELGIPPGVNQLVMRALSKRPEDRFQTIEHLQALLVEEIRAAGTSSVESLLDPRRLQRLVRTAEPRERPSGTRGALATRDEVDAYERKLRRTRLGAAGVGASLMVAAAGAGASVLAPHATKPSGVEAEPNNTAADATPLTLGQATTGILGKRIDANHGDRDFYAMDLPASAPGAKALLRLRVSALPNLPMCSMLYRSGFPDAVGQYCVGRPGRDLVIPALELVPGRYLLAVLQEQAPHGGLQSYVLENVSDAYTVLAESAIAEPGSEVEPNDRIASATQLGLSLPCAAAIGWDHDEDVFCVQEAAPRRIRWRVSTGPRESGVLEVTPLGAAAEGASFRIHHDARGQRSEADVVSPWLSSPSTADDGARQCLRVRLTTDPWSPERVGATPGGSSEPYVVEVEAAP